MKFSVGILLYALISLQALASSTPVLKDVVGVKIGEDIETHTSFLYQAGNVAAYNWDRKKSQPYECKAPGQNFVVDKMGDGIYALWDRMQSSRKDNLWILDTKLSECYNAATLTGQYNHGRFFRYDAETGSVVITAERFTSDYSYFKTFLVDRKSRKVLNSMDSPPETSPILLGKNLVYQVEMGNGSEATYKLEVFDLASFNHLITLRLEGRYISSFYAKVSKEQGLENQFLVTWFHRSVDDSRLALLDLNEFKVIETGKTCFDPEIYPSSKTVFCPRSGQFQKLGGSDLVKPLWKENDASYLYSPESGMIVSVGTWVQWYDTKTNVLSPESLRRGGHAVNWAPALNSIGNSLVVVEQYYDHVEIVQYPVANTGEARVLQTIAVPVNSGEYFEVYSKFNKHENKFFVSISIERSAGRELFGDYYLDLP